MKIFIDGDGCPVVRLTEDLARKYKLDLILVLDYSHIHEPSYGRLVQVDVHSDSADFYILGLIGPGDILVTQDYGLAAMALSKSALPISPMGDLFTDGNIDQLLNRRHIHRELRKSKVYHGKNKKRRPEDDLIFKEKLESLIKNQGLG